MDTKKLRQKILDLAIHGKLVPQDPNDEPASVLLERIRAEKERLIKEGKIKKSKASKTSDTPHYENVPFEVPNGWVWSILPNLCTIPITDGTHQTPTYTDKKHGIPFISSKDVTSQKINWDNIKYITKELHEELYKRVAPQKDDILLAKNGTTGVAAIVEDSRVFDIYVTLALIRPNKNVNPYYLYYVINSGFCKEQFNSHLTGIGLPNLHLTDIKKTFIPLPPLTEQERIVSEIKRWFTLIDKLEQEKTDLLTAIKQTKSKILDLAIHGKLVPQDLNDEPASELLKRINPNAEITCDNGQYGKMPFEIPNSWLWLSHNDILEISGGSQPAKSYFKETPENGYIRLYQIRDYGEHPVPVYIPIELASKTTQKGDILLARYGGSLGKVFIAEDGAYNVAMAKVILKFEHLLDKEFVYFYYLSKLYQDKLQTISRTAQAGFNSSDFEDMYFPLPPIEEQQRIVHRIKSLYLAIDNIQKALEV